MMNHYQMLLERTSDVVVLFDRRGIVRYANQAVEAVFGRTPAQVTGVPFELLMVERMRELQRSQLVRYLKTGVRELDWRLIETWGLHRDGHEFPAELSLSDLGDDGDQQFAAIIRDVSERKAQQARILRLNRIHAVLSGINGLIVRTRQRPELFEGVCRIAVEEGRFRLCWVGLLQGCEIRPVAFHGTDEGYLEHIRYGLHTDAPQGQGPATIALRERRPFVCNDIAADPLMARWREAALARGFRAVMCLPIVVRQSVIGCIAFYAGEPDFFDAGEQKLLTGLAGDIAYSLEFIAHDERLDFLAYYDQLTGLPNRSLFLERLSGYIHAARQDGAGMAVLQLDIERFKSINDSFGSEAGDELLKMVAARVMNLAGGSSHLVARLGGDEFGIIIPDLRLIPDLELLLREHADNDTTRPYVVAGKELRIAAKVGVALFPEDGEDAAALYRNAETALKRAKSIGERFLFYSREMSAALSERLSMESMLRRALERDEFVLHYQPKLSLPDDRICGVEALLRWNSPELGLVPPARFVPLLEESGLILPVGEWALGQAISDRRAWIEEGLEAPRVAVNVSAIQLRKADFVDAVRRVTAVHDSAALGLELEITESVLMDDVEKHIAKLKTLSQSGIRIAIDDFGTGYSSLAYLSRLPVTAVKIDRSFIVRMTDNADTMGIVSAIISLARSMNLKVVAEGVDAAEQLKFLRLMRCDELQGFLFSKPLSSGGLAALLREEKTRGALLPAMAQ